MIDLEYRLLKADYFFTVTIPNFFGGCYDVAKRNSRVSNKFKRMSELYRIFSNDWKHLLDYSDAALLELYNSESYGGKTSPMNGFAVGKKYLSVHVEMWRNDIEDGLLFKRELYEDEKFPHWWLDSIFKTL